MGCVLTRAELPHQEYRSRSSWPLWKFSQGRWVQIQKWYAYTTYFSIMEQILAVRSPLNSCSLTSRCSISSFVKDFTLLSFTRRYKSSRALLRIDASESWKMKKQSHEIINLPFRRHASTQKEYTSGRKWLMNQLKARPPEGISLETIKLIISMNNETAYIKISEIS